MTVMQSLKDLLRNPTPQNTSAKDTTSVTSAKEHKDRAKALRKLNPKSRAAQLHELVARALERKS